MGPLGEAVRERSGGGHNAGVTRFSWTDIKTLFGLSCNTCAMDGCEQTLTNPGWEQVNADIAHIRGEKPGSARYDPSMTPSERNAFENLVLLCPGCHRRIDRLEPSDFPADRLAEMKTRHEQRCAGGWATDAQLDRFSELLMAAIGESEVAETPDPPRLQIQQDGREAVFLVNVGEVDAFEPKIVPNDEATAEAWIPIDDPPQRLSPGAKLRAGAYASTLGNAGPHTLRVVWRDASGQEFDADYPLS